MGEEGRGSGQTTLINKQLKRERERESEELDKTQLLHAAWNNNKNNNNSVATPCKMQLCSAANLTHCKPQTKGVSRGGGCRLPLKRCLSPAHSANELA